MLSFKIMTTQRLSRSFWAHCLEQATGAINDNVFRMVFVAMAMVLSQVQGLPEGVGNQNASLLALAFLCPFVLFAPTAGSMADRWGKHHIIRITRCVEPVLCLCGLAAIYWQDIGFMYVCLGLLGLQSALFAPVKYAVLPELCRPEQLAQATSLTQVASNGAIVIGMALAAVADPRILDELASWPLIGPVAQEAKGSPLPMLAVVSFGVAALGIMAAFMMKPLPAQNDGSRIAMPWHMGRMFASLSTATGLWVPSLCLAGFWTLAAVINIAISSVLVHVYDAYLIEVSMCSITLAIALAIGSLLAPRFIIAAFPGGLPVCGALLASSACVVAACVAYMHAPMWLFICCLALAGFGSGLWIVPLNLLLQIRSPDDHRGQIFSATSLLGALGLVFGFIMTFIMGMYYDSLTSFAFLSALAICLVLIALWCYKDQFVAWISCCLVKLCYHTTCDGLEKVPATGGCVLICNHISYADGPILFTNLPRPARFMVHEPMVQHKLVGFPLRACGVIPVPTGGARALRTCIDRAIAAAKSGEIVVIFPEGKLSRNGQLQEFKAGMERIAQQADVPIIPACLHGLYGTATSRAAHRRLPGFRRPVRLRVGDPLPSTIAAPVARTVVSRLQGGLMSELHQNQTLIGNFLRLVKRAPKALAVQDAFGALTRMELAVGARVLAQHFGLSTTERHVGLILPPGCGGTLANVACAQLGKTAVNLNHTVGARRLDHMISLAGIETIISSRRYAEKIGLALPDTVRVLYLEDLKSTISTWGKIRAWLAIRLLPVRLLHQAVDTDVAALVFSSGSTGDPKGVQLTHQQLLANNAALVEHLGHQSRRVSLAGLLSALPLFHSFGLNAGMWLGLVQGIPVAGQADPTDGRALGKLAEKAKPDILLTTPTFARGYLRRVEPEQFASLRLAVAGAEKCSAELSEQFADRFHCALLEGYGATELGPVISCNVPHCERDGLKEIGHKAGSVGRSLPGVSAWTVHPETMERLAIGEEGLLLIESPARMQGYLGRDDLTAAAFVGEAYNTGDIGYVDADGFIFLTGRLARFAKIGGEMVPLDTIEQALQNAADKAYGEEAGDIAVASVPDDRRGERLVVLYTSKAIQAGDCTSWAEALIPLFRPRQHDIYHVEQIPVLGTGKRDLKGVKDVALRCDRAELA